MKYKDKTLSPKERAADLLARMTDEEKAAQMDMIRGVELATMVHPVHFCAIDPKSDYKWDEVDARIGKNGIGFVHDTYSAPSVLNKMQRYMVEKTRLGIPCIFTGEALHGISLPGATVYPMPIALGASFDTELVHEIGHAIGTEARSLGVCEILAPNLDLAREPRWGRTEETFGEDTYLSSQMAYAIITGEQGTDLSAPDVVAAEPKHYCVHGIPEGGLNCSPARVGRREVETSYLPVFEAGIKKAGAYNAMASYNCIDGEAVISSEYYLKEILKKRYGLRGYVRADFGAVKRLKDAHRMTGSSLESIEAAVNGGLDVQGFDFPNDEWQGGLLQLLKEGRIKRETIDEAVMRILTLKFELGLFDNPYVDENAYKDKIRCEKHREISYKAAKESIVLLKNENDILPLSRNIKSIALIGPLADAQQLGSYSSVPYGYKVRSVYEELKDYLPDCKINYALGCGINETDEDDIEKAVTAAENSEVAVIVCGYDKTTSGEGKDRCDLKLYGRQSELIERVAGLGKPAILVLESGKPVDISSECDMAQGIVLAWFGGEQGAKAICDVLFGEISPSGKLPISFPKSVGHLPCYYSMLPGGSEEYIEGNRRALYPFGYGLSYTSFEYSNMNIVRRGKCDFTVSVDITNTGKTDGDEIVQLYVEDICSSIVTPPMLLKGFKRLPLKAGETKTAVMELDFDSFKLLNKDFEWVIEPGEFCIKIGASNCDIRIEQIIEI